MCDRIKLFLTQVVPSYLVVVVIFSIKVVKNTDVFKELQANMAVALNKVMT